MTDMRKLNGRYPRTQTIKDAIRRSKHGNRNAMKNRNNDATTKKDLESKILQAKESIESLKRRIKKHDEARIRRIEELESRQRTLEKLESEFYKQPIDIVIDA